MVIIDFLERWMVGMVDAVNQLPYKLATLWWLFLLWMCLGDAIRVLYVRLKPVVQNAWALVELRTYIRGREYQTVPLNDAVLQAGPYFRKQLPRNLRALLAEFGELLGYLPAITLYAYGLIRLWT